MQNIYPRRLLVDINAPGQTHPLPHPEVVSQKTTMAQCVQDDCPFRVGVLELLCCQSPSWMYFLEDKTDNLLAWHIYIGNQNALPLKAKQGKRGKIQ